MRSPKIDFKKKINKNKITYPVMKHEVNYSLGAINTFYKKDRPSLFQCNSYNNKLPINQRNNFKKNYTFYESKSLVNKDINKNQINLSYFRRRDIPFEEEKHVTYIKTSSRKELTEEFEGLRYTKINYNNNTLKKDNLKLRLNSFHVRPDKYNNYTLDSVSNKKELINKMSKSSINKNLNNEPKKMKIPQIIPKNPPMIPKNENTSPIVTKIKKVKIMPSTIPIKKNDKNKKIPSSKNDKKNPFVSKNGKNILTNTKKEKIQKNVKFRTKILEHEKTIKDKIRNENKNKLEEDDEWDIEQFQGLRKKTLNINRIKNNLNQENKLNEINSLFSKNIYIKSCKATSIAGKDEDGLKKVNQDTYIIERNINGVLNFNIFGVLDGHGMNGHLVSQFVSRHIINRIRNHYLIKNEKIPNEIYHKLKANGYEIIADIFCEADIQLAKQTFDCQTSGTTCVIVIQLEEKIICANAGDSRAIIIYDDSNNQNLSNTKIYPLSYDCKPDNPIERQRIIECGGSVEQAEDENGIGVGPYRVWAKGEEYPGLAMSRCLGDLKAKKIGVIPYPQIIEYQINDQSKYMLICSDGIWEFISNEEAKNIGNKYYLRNDPIGLCHELTNKSTTLWLKEDIVIDDITVVVVFF